MKEHPILFSTSMVRAIIEGRKTQTRRVMNPQPPTWSVKLQRWLDTNPKAKQSEIWMMIDRIGEPLKSVVCPYGQPSDRLWVRETWTETNYAEMPILYKATDEHKKQIVDAARIRLHGDPYSWKPSIHMKRIHSRITLEVLNVRVERVQEITEEDAVAEGSLAYYVKSYEDRTPDNKHAFRMLWDSINGKREGCSWDDNPWVFVVEFKKIAQ